MTPPSVWTEEMRRDIIAALALIPKQIPITEGGWALEFEHDGLKARVEIANEWEGERCPFLVRWFAPHKGHPQPVEHVDAQGFAGTVVRLKEVLCLP